eukprot:scaffold7622_cov130-Isochrysis_galbana.AAC.7
MLLEESRSSRRSAAPSGVQTWGGIWPAWPSSPTRVIFIAPAAAAAFFIAAAVGDILAIRVHLTLALGHGFAISLTKGGLLLTMKELGLD